MFIGLMKNSVLTYIHCGLRRSGGMGVVKEAVMLKKEGEAFLLRERERKRERERERES